MSANTSAFDILGSFFGWMPGALRVLAVAVLLLFVLLTILRIWKFIKDLIPFF